MKRFSRYIPLLFVPAFAVQYAAAQSGFDVNIGFGGLHDSAATTGIDQNTLISCAPGATGCVSTPALSGFTLGLGANLMLWKHFGVGGEVNFQTGKQEYALLQQQVVSTGTPGLSVQSRATFYDFNGIYQPVSTKRAALSLMGGIGGMNLKFYENQSVNDALAGGQSFSQYIESSNHFQIHAGAGVQVYLKEHIFLRPQFDYHYVTNLTQFGSKNVIEGSVWLGYSFGDRQ